jgi:hypothetical protein
MSTVSENTCTSIFQCTLFMINWGVRSGGGIGDVLPRKSYFKNRDSFIGGFVYNLVFHIVIVLILGNIFLGIIVDAFADLRDINYVIENDKMNVCFICQLDRTKAGVCFDKHITETHDLWLYCFFIVYLKLKNKNDFNCYEYYVWEKMERKELDWFPIQNITD